MKTLILLISAFTLSVSSAFGAGVSMGAFSSSEQSISTGAIDITSTVLQNGTFTSEVHNEQGDYATEHGTFDNSNITTTKGTTTGYSQTETVGYTHANVSHSSVSTEGRSSSALDVVSTIDNYRASYLNEFGGEGSHEDATYTETLTYDTGTVSAHINTRGDFESSYDNEYTNY